MPIVRNNFNLFGSILMKVANSLKVFVVVTMTIFYIYLQTKSNTTGNWETTRRVGFSQPGYCDHPKYSYGVTEFGLFYNGSTVVNPLCYKTDATISDDKMPCVSVEDLYNCDAVFQKNHGSLDFDNFKTRFQRKPRNYFPNSVYIIIIGFMCSILTNMFETNKVSTGDDGQPVESTYRTMMVRLNVLLSMGLIALLIASSQAFMLIREEICHEVYLPQADDDTFCSDLTSCGAGVSSVITPGESLVLNYRLISLLFAIFIAIGSMLKCMRPTQDLLLQQQPGQHFRLGATSRARVVPVGGSTSPQGEMELQINVLTRNWTTLSSMALLDLEDDEGYALDCAICLNPMCVEKQGGNVSRLRTAAKKVRRKPNDNTATVYDTIISLENETENETEELDVCPVDSFFVSSERAVVAAVREEDHGHIDIEQQLVQSMEPCDVPLEVVRVPCGHVFHRSCILQWSISSRRTCPVCRKRVDGQ